MTKIALYEWYVIGCKGTIFEKVNPHTTRKCEVIALQRVLTGILLMNNALAKIATQVWAVMGDF